jgi:acetoin utilization deacetylase AcuC-like enzyme
MLPILYSDEFLNHKTGAYHPECPGRLTAATTALQQAFCDGQLDWRSPTPLSERDVMPAIEAVHTSTYVHALAALAQCGGGRVDPDTVISSESYDIAQLAVSAWLDGVDYALTTGGPIFVLARPPGHHALRDRGMGFCLLSNAAIAAHYALEKSTVNRVAILDWDVHHGNGTQAIVETHPHIAYCSLHQYPFYPGTGAAQEQGTYHNVLNIPLAAGSPLAVYQRHFETQILPFLQAFQPDLLIVSAGYDANAADPLAEMALQPQDYGVLTDYCLQITRKIVFGLEGGYDFESLGQSIVATVKSCLIFLG